VWAGFVEACREQGLAGVGWTTIGIRPPDERRAMFDGEEEAGCAAMRRSVPVSSLAFVEVSFFYAGGGGKRAPDGVRRAVRKLSSRLAQDMLSASRHVQSVSGL
jgi:hypothetical protein